MSSKSDAKALQDAINSGIDAYLQVEKLSEDAAACLEAAEKINDLNQKIDAVEACQAIAAQGQLHPQACGPPRPNRWRSGATVSNTKARHSSA